MVKIVQTTEEESDNFSVSEWGNSERVLTQHRIYKTDDEKFVVIVVEMNDPNTWDDDAFEAICEDVTTRFNAADQPNHGTKE